MKKFILILMLVSLAGCSTFDNQPPVVIQKVHTRDNLHINGNITADGFISGKKAGVFAYLDNPEVTYINKSEIYYAINGSFINNPIFCFDVKAIPAIKYNCTTPQYFEVDWHATLSADKANTNIYIGIKRNGVFINKSEMKSRFFNADEPYSFSGTTVVYLDYNDTVQLVVSSDDADENVLFQTFTTSISEFYD